MSNEKDDVSIDGSIGERRSDKRVLMPTLVIFIDGDSYVTKDWSLGGVLLSHYFRQRAQGEDIEGNVGVVTVSGRHPFKGVVVRQDATRGELALQFTELSDVAFALLKDASTGDVRQD